VKHENGSILFIIKPWMEKFNWLTVGITSRLGGVSNYPWNEFNQALHVGDHPTHVIFNRQRLAEAIGIDFAQWTCAEQVHGYDVAQVGQSNVGSGRLSRDQAIPSKDALITQEKDVMLNAFFADCVPIWLVDPTHRAIGLVHAGWRGSSLDVVSIASRAMSEAYHTDPSELHAAIGPSIRGCCYEVDDVVMDRMKSADDSFGEYYYQTTSEHHYRLDLAKFNQHKLLKAGILPEHIEISEYCTACHTDVFYSHRREFGQTGRMSAWIAMK
jgi:YfiH family protein